MFKCKSCGGDLIFNIEKQDMECMFCNSHFPVEDYSEDKYADQNEVYETTVYTCTQCGAELLSQDNAAVAFCSYCGTEAVLEGRISSEYKPAHIIPFKKTKEECRSIYLGKTKKEPYVPKEFSDPKFIDKFRGIYIPYWEYEVGFKNEPKLKVKESYSQGNYTYDNVYDVQPDIKNTKITIPRDASSGFDDEIANEIAPYHKENITDFNPAYLAGFFADTADVDKELYSDDVTERAQEHVLSDITSDFKSGATVEIPSGVNKAELLGSRCEDIKGSLYPVWFLTWRKGKRLAYGVVNGETGKISAEIPVDIGKFMRVSAVIAVIVFIAMTITGTLILPPTVMLISTAAALVTQYYYKKEVSSIRDKEMNENNLGALSGEDLSKAKQKKRRKKGIRGGHSGVLAVIAVILCFMILPLADTAGRAAFLIPVMFIVGLVFYIGTLKPLTQIEEKRMFLGATLPVAAEFIAAAIALTAPAQDWIYYIGCIAVFGSLTVTSLSLILEYNLLTTRSVPDFHNREGGARHERSS